MIETAGVTVLALLASLHFAVGALLVKRGLHQTDSVSGSIITIATSLVIFGAAAVFTMERAEWSSPAIWIFAAIGLLRPSFSTMLANEGKHRLGPTISATVEAASPLFAVMGGILLLSEPVEATTLIGAAGVVAGIMLLCLRGRGSARWSPLALLFPFCAALIRSGAHVGARWGLTLLPNVILTGMIAYAVSFLIASSTAGLGRKLMGTRRALQGWKWFVLAGLANSGAIFTLNSALMLGSVSRVSPLIATYPLFTMILSAVFYRQEPITRLTVLAVAIVVPSVMLITLGH
ncbi:MAG: DMT family transporter [SAR324 cluster bacterium]|nr:DMT family transporter [SAR324 cluster bacterium]MCH8885004.1 DMT family transporter [SAR324 cluster bacterium]